MFIQPKFRLRSKPSLLRYLFISLLVSSTLWVKGSDTITNISNIPTCLGDGLYGTKVSFLSGKNENWKVFEVFNLSDSLSTSTNQIAILPNSSLKEATQSLNKSLYSVYGKYKSGNKYFIRFINKFGKYHTVYAGGESYQNLNIAGKNAVCLNSIEFYEVPPFSNGYKVVLNGGTILSSNIDSSRVEVRWSNLPGNYNISFERKGQLNCFSKAIRQVAVGSSSTAMACKANLQISLDNNCVLNVTPQLLSSVNIAPNEPYAVVLLQGSLMLPNNQLNYSHVGKTITAKLIQGCSGNSCWTSLSVEDKAAPKIICKDTIVVNCFDKHYPKPIAIDNCDHIVQTTLIDSNFISNPCNNVYSVFINMSYTAKDKLGNKSKICNQILAIKRIPFDSIAFPENFTHDNALSCRGFKKDKNGMPSPDLTGYPNYNCMNIDLNHSQTCNVYSNYEDTRFGYNGCIEKIMRKWTLVEWYCNESKVRTHTQVIYIKDDVAPTIKCPNPKTISAEGNNCIATFKFDPLLEVKDECSTSFEYTVKYGNGGITNLTTSISLAPTMYPLIYTVTDQCGNSSTCTSSLKVLDLSAPVVVCHQTTVVGLNSFGDAHIYPSSINDGSYDFCGLDSFKIRRMDDTLGFREKIHFSCLDVAKEIMVEMRVWNKTGLANSCMSFVNVQDKNKPTIFCPKDVTISCEENYDLNNLKKYGEATGNDACDYVIRAKAKEVVNQCRVGFIERTFTIYDKQDSASCKSKIVLKKDNGTFVVKWPKDYTVKDSCSIANLQPEKLPKGFDAPVVETNGGCQLIATNYSDDYFTLNDNGSCFKIIRTWTVIDYCLMNDTNYVPSIHQQLIKVNNTIDPVILLDADTSACTLDTDCDSGKIKLKASATDDCTMKEKLRWRYQIDFNFNGTFKADSTRYFNGSSVDASGEFPVGKHQIIFTVEDGCGNAVSKFHDFVIKNCKAPIAVCKESIGVTLGIMLLNGQEVKMACIDAESINQSSSSLCEQPFTFSFSADKKDSTICFDCTKIGVNSVDVFVIGQDGIFSKCKTRIDVMDNSGNFLDIIGVPFLCEGDSTILTASSSFNNYIWSTGESSKSIKVKPSSTTTYTLKSVVPGGCVINATKTLKVNPNTIGIQGLSEFCNGVTTTLSVNEVGTYIWNNNQTGNAITVKPSINTMYTVTLTYPEGCKAIGRKNVIVNEVPIVNITGQNPICEGDRTLLSIADYPTSYNIFWTNGVSASATVFLPTIGDQVFRVTVTSDKGCVEKDTIFINLNPKPVGKISGRSSICLGESTELTASGGGTYFWNVANITEPTITVKPNSNSVYTITVTNEFGCRDVESINITVISMPNIFIIGDTVICPGESTTLTGFLQGEGETYLWSTGQTTAGITISPIVTTTYTVTVTTVEGCKDKRTVRVVVENCLNKDEGSIVGTISNANSIPIENFKVCINNQEEEFTLSDENGEFKFDPLEEGIDYSIKAIKNDETLNGLSTLDLIAIQRHILGTKKLDNPYSIIAADVNNDRKITAKDLVELRKVLLGIKPNFENESWRVIDKNFTFPDKQNPLSNELPNYFSIMDLQGINKVDLVGIKLGDVIDSGNNTFGSGIHENIVPKDGFFEKIINTTTSMDGIQLEINLNLGEQIVFSTVFDIDEYSFNQNGSKVKVLFSPTRHSILEGTTLFKIISENSNKVNLNNTFSEYYKNYASIKLLPENNQSIKQSTNYAIFPNPFVDFINIILPDYVNYDVAIYDGSGIMIKKYTSIEIGELNGRLDLRDLNSNKVYFLKVKDKVNVLKKTFTIYK